MLSIQTKEPAVEVSAEEQNKEEDFIKHKEDFFIKRCVSYIGNSIEVLPVPFAQFITC